MKRWSRAVPGLCLALLPAGCLQDAPAPLGAGAEPGLDATGPDDRLADRVDFTNCESVVVVLRTPRGIIQEPAPHPWEGDGSLRYHRYDGFSCARVGWGDAEWAPVAFVLEGIGLYDFPAACRPGASGLPMYLRAVYTDHEQLGQAFYSDVGTTWFNATVEVRLDGATATPGGSLQWSAPTGDSTVLYSAPFTEDGNQLVFESIYVTSDGRTSARLLLDAETGSAGLDGLAGVAELLPPAAASYRLVPRFGVEVGQFGQFTVQGVISQWSGPNCS